MERPVNPFKRGGISWEIMEMSIQGEFDGLPGTEDLTMTDIANVLGIDRESVSSAICWIKRKTGYTVPYVKEIGGRKKEV